MAVPTNMAPSAMRRPAKTLIVLILLSIVGGLTYINTLDAPFILDDIPNIVENPWIRMTEINLTQISRVSKSITPRPLAHLTAAFNYYFHQYHLSGYHIVNILIHILNAMLIFFLADKMLRWYWPNTSVSVACLIALAWLVHPLHTQSVTYIVQRMTALATLFYLLALVCYIKAAKMPVTERGKMIVKVLLFLTVILSGILGMLCKPIVATLPIVVFLYEWYFRRDLSFAWLKQQYKWLIPLAVLLIVLAGIYLGTNPVNTILSMYAQQDFTIGERLLTQPGVIIFYLSLIAIPHPKRLTIDHDFPIADLTLNPISTALPVLTLLLLLGLIIMSSRRNRLLGFAILWFLVNLMIESSILGLALIFEHRTYLPTILLFIFFGARVHQWRLSPALKLVLFGLIFFTSIFWTYQRNTTWQNATRFWEDGMAKAPLSARPYASLGAVLTKAGQPNRAISFYRQALALDPDDKDTYNNFGAALQKTGQLSEARNMYQKALTLAPNYAKAYNNLGIVLVRTGHITKAIHMYQKAIAIDPGYADAYNHLGVALAENGQIKNALAMYQKALTINPQYAAAYNNWGLALSAQNKPVEAIAMYQKALRINSGYTEAHVNMGVAQIHQSQPDKALPHLLRALKLDPKIKEVHTNLAIAYAQTGQWRQAEDHCRQALSMSPGCAATMYNLSLIYQQQGQLENAKKWILNALSNAPNNIQIRSSLIETLIAAGDHEAAMKNAQTALAIDPDNLSALMSLGALYARQKENTNAIRTYNHLTRLLPDNPTIYYNLACLHARQNEIAASITNLKKAVSKGYNNWVHIKTDPDLANIRQTNDYQTIIKKASPHATNKSI